MLQALSLTLALSAMLVLPGSVFADGPLHEVPGSPSEIESSWTGTQFRNAEPAPGPAARFGPPVGDLPPAAQSSSADGSFYPRRITELPTRLHGKVFFRMGISMYQCSATLVESKLGGSVFTAGHCVYDPATKRWASDFVFVPAYENGSEPFGRYAAASLRTTSNWRKNQDLAADIGVATLAGNPTAALGGAAKIAFDLDLTGRRYLILGYPGRPAPPFDGERLVGCRSAFLARDAGDPPAVSAGPCPMADGASGGAWMSGGYLNGVTSYVKCRYVPETCGQVFSPYFSKFAKRLYKSDTVGGALQPTVRITKHPPARVKKRKVLFEFAGEGSTPLRYRCSFDSRPYAACRARTTISRLGPGRHSLRVRSVDQTGQVSRKAALRKFWVSRPR